MYPSTIVFRAIEFKFLVERCKKYLSLRPAIELGCGEGIATKTVFGEKIDYGLDLNKISVKQARKSGAYGKVFLSSATKMPLKNGSVELVFSNSSVEHMLDLDGVLSEASRICKKEGCLVFTVPTGNLKKYSVFSFLGLKKVAGIYGKMRDKRLDHFHCHGLSWWKKELAKHDFEVVDGYYYLNKKTIEYWDFLSIVHKLTLWTRLWFPGLMEWVYVRFWRKNVFEYYKKAVVLRRGGAAVCVVAKRV